MTFSLSVIGRLTLSQQQRLVQLDLMSLVCMTTPAFTLSGTDRPLACGQGLSCYPRHHAIVLLVLKAGGRLWSRIVRQSL